MKKLLQQRGYDNLDQAILEELQQNGRMSVADLARKIHLSQPAVHNRIKRLEREGVIRQYVALLDHQQIGYDLMCFLQLTLNPHSHEVIQAVRDQIQQEVVVLECYSISGRADMLLKIIIENQRALNDFIQQLTKMDGIERIETALVLDYIKLTTELSLE
ncbi:MAG: Lrp/AsnC family transcriptional regulator [Phototrophicaceae bacterium]